MVLRDTIRDSYIGLIGLFSPVEPRTYFLSGHVASNRHLSAEEQQHLLDIQMRELSRDYDIVDPATAVANLHQTKHRLLCITFDDGLEDCYDIIAPVLDSRKLSALFFINPAYLDLDEAQLAYVMKKYYERSEPRRLMTSAQVLELHERGHVIGSHSYSHVRLNTANPVILEREIGEAKEAIEQLTGSGCPYFAYPFGAVSDLSAEALEIALTHHPYVFSSTTSHRRFEFGGRVINRRHFEGDWPVSHIDYFLSKRAD